MKIRELIALASIRSGKRQGELGLEMGHTSKTKISKMGAGVVEPDASEIVYLAKLANLPPLDTLADIESERHPELAEIWKQLKSSKGTWLNT